MELGDFLGRISDTYERKARLYPALLALAPVFGIAVCFYGLEIDWQRGLLGLLISIGGLFLLSNIAREAGKRRESGLFESWGGVPTTQLQRHRDNTIDAVTKRARHESLSGKLGVPFPDVAAELADPTSADQIYAAGTRWLLERTRDRRQFPLLFAENVAYGFRRNALGLKPIAIIISLAAIAWVLVAQGVLAVTGVNFAALTRLPKGALSSIVISSLFLLVWILYFTKRSVRTAAFSYADMLLRTCSLLP
jgi:hypothetical protein